MPLVRIDLQKGKDAAYRQKAGQIVYEAMVAHTGVPKNDHFQIISEHSIENFIFDPDYLGIHRTNDLIMVQIFFNEGRSVAQKQALYRAIADGLSGVELLHGSELAAEARSLLAWVGDRLAKSLVREAWIGARKRRRAFA